MLLTATVILLLVASCTSRKPLVPPVGPPDYQWMSARMNGKLQMASGEMNFSGTVRMRRDSVVWMSVTALMGMESARALITQDSVVFVNRMDQTYLAEPYADVAGRLHLPPTLQETQATLLGNGTDGPVEIQFGPYRARIQYTDVHWDEPTVFPMRINQNYERVRP